MNYDGLQFNSPNRCLSNPVNRRANKYHVQQHFQRKASTFPMNGISTAVTQKLLEHSSPDLTNKVYTNVDPVLRHAVEQLPVGEWL
jgi:hypothetical protein